MRASLRDLLFQQDKLNPIRLGNTAAWYDLSLPASTTSNDIRIDAANRVSLIADKSGNSAVNCLCLNGVAGNYASFTALTAFGTGGFSVSAKVTITSLSATSGIFGGAGSNFALRVVATTGLVQATKDDIASLTPASSGVTTFTECVVGYTRSGTTGTYYINGVAAGVITDNNNYTAGVSTLGVNGVGNIAPAFALFKWARVYSAALDATAMAADAAGTVQANCVLNIDWTSYAKLAASPVTAATGQSITINATGDLGARIAGERDLYQATAAKQPLYVTQDSNGCYTTPGLGISTAGVDRDCVNSDGSTANRRAGWSLGSPGAIAGQTITKLAEVQIGASAPAANWWIQIGSAVGAVANGLFLNFYTDGSLEIRQYGATGSDYRRALYANFQTDYAGQWVRISAVVTGDSTTKPTIIINGVDKTASFVTAEVGSYPNWQPTTLSTSGYWIDRPPALRFVPHAPILGALSNAEAVTWTSGGDLPTWCEVGTGRATPSLTTNFTAGVDGWLNSGGGSVVADTGNNELDVTVGGTGAGTQRGYTFTVGRKYRLVVEIANLSAGLRLSVKNGAGGYISAYQQINANGVYAFDFIATSAWTAFAIQEDGGTAGTFSIKGGTTAIYLLGPLAKWVIQPNQTIADAGTNGITGTLATGCNPILYRPMTCVWFDGSDDYMKAPAFALSQPETVYFVGKQVTWTNGEGFYDGNANQTMLLYQSTSTPRVDAFASGAGFNGGTGLTLQTSSVVSTVFNTSSSSNRINRSTASTGTVGSVAANGFLIGSNGSPSAYANITVSEVLIRSASDGPYIQDRIIRYAGRKWGIQS
jgi:hypothetical protein